MKLLAIHENKIFFKKGAPNFYTWLADRRGFKDKEKALHKQYEKEKGAGPLLLKKTYELTVKDLTSQELVDYSKTYNDNYFNLDIVSELKRIKEQAKIIVFTSFPKELYDHLLQENLVNKVFGVEARLDENNKIISFKEVSLKNEKEVKEKMAEIGFSEKFSQEPNRYGLLELLIDEMINSGIGEDEVVLLGKGITAEPMHKVSAKQVDNLSEV